jgi:hypothetical protein
MTPSKKRVTFDEFSRTVVFDPSKHGHQRFKRLEPTKSKSVNNNSVYGPWKKPKGRYFQPHQPEKPFFRKYTVNVRGAPVRTLDDTGFRLENLMYYQNKIAKLAEKRRRNQNNKKL